MEELVALQYLVQKEDRVRQSTMMRTCGDGTALPKSVSKCVEVQKAKVPASEWPPGLDS